MNTSISRYEDWFGAIIFGTLGCVSITIGTAGMFEVFQAESFALVDMILFASALFAAMPGIVSMYTVYDIIKYGWRHQRK